MPPVNVSRASGVYTEDGTCVVRHVEPAFCCLRRMVGLLGRRDLPEGAALWIKPCGSVHTFFMRFELDLVFLSSDLRVVRVVKNVRPFRLASGGRSAHSVLEMAAGWMTDELLKEGERVVIEQGGYSSGSGGSSRMGP